MKWEYWICLYTQTHCTARGLKASTIGAYVATLNQFHTYIEARKNGKEPDEVTAADVLEYIRYLRVERNNGHSAVSRQVTVLKEYYKAIVAMDHLEPSANPMAHFPPMKGRPRKLPVVLSREEVERLVNQPGTDTVQGLRDRAILTLLYGTGIRASECAGLLEGDVDLANRTIRVTGKGGHECAVFLNEGVVQALRVYREARGLVLPGSAFFRSRSKKAMTRGAVYQRVRHHGQAARIPKRVTPHVLRHTCATHLVRAGVKLVVIRDLLGHRSIASTQVYLHVTAQDLEEAAERHPIGTLAPMVVELLPNVKLPFQRPPQRLRSG